MPSLYSDPGKDCALCPRLAAFRKENRQQFPSYWNAPVPAFGSERVSLVVVGLAPGLHGANQTSRPFTGDYAGDLLYETMIAHGFARGTYERHRDDGLSLVDARITNAVHCVPPQNKPTGPEITQCRQFLSQELEMLRPHLKVIVALGTIAHASVLRALSQKVAHYPFGHGNEHAIDDRLTLIDSYHCSRYNTNTGRLTPAMFNQIFESARTHVDAPNQPPFC